MAESIINTQLKELIDNVKTESYKEGYQMGWDDAMKSYERYTCKAVNSPVEEKSVGQALEDIKRAFDTFCEAIERMENR